MRVKIELEFEVSLVDVNDGPLTEADARDYATWAAENHSVFQGYPGHVGSSTLVNVGGDSDGKALVKIVDR